MHISVPRNHTFVQPSKLADSPWWRAFPHTFACILLSVALSGCRPTDRSEGVELVTSTSEPTPAMTFELRFEAPMVNASALDVALTNSPLAIRPSLAGTFRWITASSGVFTPREPLAMDTRYELSLQPGLVRADGQPSQAKLHQIVSTPPFGLAAIAPRASNTNAASNPQIKLLFNQDIRAAEALPFIYFRDNTGRRVPAEVCQGTAEEFDYELRYPSQNRPWYDAYHTAKRTYGSSPEEAFERGGTNELPNFLVVGPRDHLPLGKGWKLSVVAGLPSQNRRFRLRDTKDILIGDVAPFQLTEVTAENRIFAKASIRLWFSKAVSDSLTNGIDGWLTLSPSPTNINVAVDGSYVRLSGDFEGGRTYKLALDPNFQALEPFKIRGETNFAVQIPHVAPRLYFPALSSDQLANGNRTLPLLGVNVPQVRLRAKILDPQTAIYALRGYSSYFIKWNERSESDFSGERYRPINYDLLAGRTVFSEQIELNADADASKTLDLKWDQLLHGRKTGVVFLDAERAKPDSERAATLGAQAIIQLTDLGLVWKTARTGVDVFAFSHGTGLPVSGATARLYSSENESLSEALTDTNGIAHLAANTNCDWVAVQHGDDFHALPINEERIWLYRFGIPQERFDEPEDNERVLLFSDRHLYRPGEAMNLFGLARKWGEPGLLIPTGLTATLDCLDRKGRRFFQTNLMFTTAGGCSVTVPLPAGLRGACSAKLRIGTNDYIHPFSVQDFEADAFEVSLECSNSFAADDKISASVSANYLFGKPLSRAKVQWSLSASDTTFRPEGFGDYHFERADLSSRYGHGVAPVNLSGEGQLAGAGTLLIAADLPANSGVPKPRSGYLHVEVTDVNQQTISDVVNFTRHSSDFYLGLRQTTAVLTNGETLPLEILTVGADGKPWPKTVQAHLTLQRVDWQSIRLQGAGKSVRYHNEATYTNLLERDIEIQPVELPREKEEPVVGNRLEHLPPLPAGEYFVEATTTDAAGHPVASSLNFQVSAEGQFARAYRDETQLVLKPAQTEYQPGTSAKILVEAPFSGTALVTVEREKVLRSFTKRLEGNAPFIEIPIQSGDAPNIFVSVVLLRGADESTHKIKEPEYRIGYCQLQVATPQSKLAVTVTPTVDTCQPGEIMEVTVRVADGLGAGVGDAAVVLYAVDEGVLNLSDPGLPDPHGLFYGPRSLSVQSSVSLPNLLTEDPDALSFENKGFLIGDGKECRKGGMPETVRKKFLACAYWNANLTTDADGRTTARFAAPDNLTRYRLCAVAHSGAGRFGSGKSAFQVSKPLVIEPALPGFVNVTDQLIARGVVQNQTTNNAEVLVTLQLDDKVTNAPAERLLTRKLIIPAKSSTAVEFPVELGDLGPAAWTWSVRFADPALGDFKDSVESVIEVGHVVPMLREILLGHGTFPQTNLLSQANPQLLAGKGTVTVTIANTRLNDLGEAILQLLHYPYGCAEQTGSSLLPWIVLRDTDGLLPALRRGTNEINAAIRAGVDRLFSMQTSSGGLAYWPRQSEPMLWASAYGGMVLALAQQHGIEVPTEEFESLKKYLSRQLRSSPSDPSELSDRCLALYALALAGHPEPAYHEKLYAEREKLGAEDRAMLALAIAESNGPETMVGELLKPVKGAHRSDDTRFGCAAREEAVRLLAWSKHRPDSALLDRYVEDLMHDQKEAHWGTTQGDAWALLALTEYARLVEGKLQPVDGHLQWNGQLIAFHLNDRTNLFSQIFAITNITGAPLTLSSSSTNRIYSSVMIEARPPETRLARQDHGFGIQRRYERLDDDNQRSDAGKLRVGDRVLVTLNLSVREPARFVAVDDALPAILEGINAEFKSRQTGASAPKDEGDYWLSNYREVRKDRCLYFVDSLMPGNYTLRYVARVRAAGTVTAPPAKIEEMYHPERCGLSGTQTISSQALD